MLAAFTAMLSVSSEMRYIYDIEDAGLRFNAVALTSPVAYMDDKFPMSFYTNLMLGKDFRKEKWGAYVNFDRLLPLGKMPPTFLVTSSGDFLAREHTRRCARDLKERGVECQLMDFEKFGGKDLPHVFPVIYPSDEAGNRAIDEMLRFFGRYIK
jgi:acetyl esterase/lipase